MGTLLALFWAHVYSAVLHMGRDVDVINMSHFAAFMSFHRSVEVSPHGGKQWCERGAGRESQGRLQIPRSAFPPERPRSRLQPDSDRTAGSAMRSAWGACTVWSVRVVNICVSVSCEYGG